MLSGRAAFFCGSDFKCRLKGRRFLGGGDFKCRPQGQHFFSGEQI
jgi:hypothetical protein